MSITRFHHSVVKAAARRGITLTHDVADRLVIVNAEELLSVERFDSTAEAFAAFDAGEVQFEAPRSSNGRCGVMVASYHARYSANPHGPGCGDRLDVALRDFLLRQPTEKGEKARVDLVLLRECAENNDVWNSAWGTLNPGMQRMNLANRLRGVLRRDSRRTVGIGGETGRFGVVGRVVQEKEPAIA
jgi:hypothetical protein